MGIQFVEFNRPDVIDSGFCKRLLQEYSTRFIETFAIFRTSVALRNPSSSLRGTSWASWQSNPSVIILPHWSLLGSIVCATHIGRLVGVMSLNVPIDVTPKTYSVSFNFLVTNNGVQWCDENSTTKDIPDDFNSAPFSGYFKVFTAD